MENYKLQFIEFLSDIGALKFGEFTTKSGRLSPYFINTGEFRTGSQIGRLGEFYAFCIRSHISSGEIPADIDMLFGPAYKGIPLAVSASIALSNFAEPEDSGYRDIGYCFNRKEEKDHGEGGSFVGSKITDGCKVLLLDDVITAGTAAREIIPLVRSAAKDVQICGMIISVDRMERGTGALSAAAELEKEQGIRVFPIVNIKEIMATQDTETQTAIEEYLEKYGDRVIPAKAGISEKY
jgi:orotate phosphoribosyltransferase